MADSVKFSSLRGRGKFASPTASTNTNSDATLHSYSPSETRGGSPPSSLSGYKHASTPTSSTFSSVVHSALRNTHRRWRSDLPGSPTEDRERMFEISAPLTIRYGEGGEGKPLGGKVTLVRTPSEALKKSCMACSPASASPPPWSPPLLPPPRPKRAPPSPPTLSISVPCPHLSIVLPRSRTPPSPPTASMHPAATHSPPLTPQRAPPLANGRFAPVVLRRPLGRGVIHPRPVNAVHKPTGGCGAGGSPEPETRETSHGAAAVLPLTPRSAVQPLAALTTTTAGVAAAAAAAAAVTASGGAPPIPTVPPFRATLLQPQGASSDLVVLHIGGAQFATCVATLLGTASHLARWLRETLEPEAITFPAPASGGDGEKRGHRHGSEDPPHVRPVAPHESGRPKLAASDDGSFEESRSTQSAGVIDQQSVVRTGRNKSMHPRLMSKECQDDEEERASAASSVYAVGGAAQGEDEVDSPVDGFLRPRHSPTAAYGYDDMAEPESPTPTHHHPASLSLSEVGIDGRAGSNATFNVAAGYYLSRHAFPTTPKFIPSPSAPHFGSILRAARSYGSGSDDEEGEGEDDPFAMFVGSDDSGEEGGGRAAFSPLRKYVAQQEVEARLSQGFKDPGSGPSSAAATSTLADDDSHSPASAAAPPRPAAATAAAARPDQPLELFLDRGPEAYVAVLHFLRRVASPQLSVASLLPPTHRVPEGLPRDLIGDAHLLELWGRLSDVEEEAAWLGMSFLGAVVEAEKAGVKALLERGRGRDGCRTDRGASKLSGGGGNASRPGWI